MIIRGEMISFIELVAGGYQSCYRTIYLLVFNRGDDLLRRERRAHCGDDDNKHTLWAIFVRCQNRQTRSHAFSFFVISFDKRPMWCFLLHHNLNLKGWDWAVGSRWFSSGAGHPCCCLQLNSALYFLRLFLRTMFGSSSLVGHLSRLINSLSSQDLMLLL